MKLREHWIGGGVDCGVNWRDHVWLDDKNRQMAHTCDQGTTVQVGLADFRALVAAANRAEELVVQQCPKCGSVLEGDKLRVFPNGSRIITQESLAEAIDRALCVTTHDERGPRISGRGFAAAIIEQLDDLIRRAKGGE